MMKGLTFLLLGAAGAQAQTVCQNDSNGDGRVGVDGKPAAARPSKHGRGHCAPRAYQRVASICSVKLLANPLPRPVR